MTGQELMAPGPGVAGPDERVRVLGAVRWVFSDSDWTKSVLFACVFILIPIVGPIALAGWMCEIHQRLVRGHPRPMPKLDFADFVHYLSRGIYPFVVQLILTLPIALVMYGLVFAAGMFLMVVASHGGGPSVALIAVGAGVGLVALVGSLVVAVLLNAARTRAELTEDIGQALSFGEMMRYSRATWAVVVWKTIAFGFVSLGLFLCGGLLLCVGIYLAAVVIQLAACSLRFQIYRDYLRRGGAPIALKEPVALPSEALPAAYPGY